MFVTTEKMKDTLLVVRPSISDHSCSARSIAKSLSAFSVAWLCLQSVFSPTVAQGKYAPFPIIYISSQSTDSIAARLAAQNALFEKQFEDDMKASPESETSKGDYRD